MPKVLPDEIDGNLRKFNLRVPEVIRKCSGIVIFGKRIKSLVFSTDLCIIKNVNADAIIAVYPFTPQPVITQALLMAADIPVFAGVGGGLTGGQRVVNLAMFAEMQGATGVENVQVAHPFCHVVVSTHNFTVVIPNKRLIEIIQIIEQAKSSIVECWSLQNRKAAIKIPTLTQRYFTEFLLITAGFNRLIFCLRASN